MGSGVRLADKVAVVVGAGSGIGRETAMLFAREGARVVAADINEDAAEGLASELAANGADAAALGADVAKVEDCRRVVETSLAKMGRIDVLVNCAAVTARNALPGSSDPEALFDRIIDVNLKGSYFLAFHAVPEMKRSGRGSIVFLSSVAGLVAYPKGLGSGFSPYVCSKGGLVQLAKNLAVELAADRIRVNCVCPGWVVTPMSEATWSNPAIRGQVEARTPMGRMAEPAEVAAAALFLASDDSSYVTGSNLVVDGGFTAQ